MIRKIIGFVTGSDWILPVGAGLAALVAIIVVISGIKKEARLEGRAEAVSQIETIIQTENLNNRAAEKKDQEFLVTRFNDFETKLTASQVKEGKSLTKIETIVKEVPKYNQCVVDQAILDERNLIRAEGPK